MFADHHACLVKKSALRPNANEATGPNQSTIDDEDNHWYKFDDDEVTDFPESDLFKHAGGSYLIFTLQHDGFEVLSITGDLFESFC